MMATGKPTARTTMTNVSSQPGSASGSSIEMTIWMSSQAVTA
jgi:hypothetical protein